MHVFEIVSRRMLAREGRYENLIRCKTTPTGDVVGNLPLVHNRETGQDEVLYCFRTRVLSARRGKLEEKFELLVAFA